MTDNKDDSPPLITDENSVELIPVLDQVVEANQSPSRLDSKHLSLDEKELLALRDELEKDMNKKIRLILQDTERRLQKELQTHLDDFLKQL